MSGHAARPDPTVRERLRAVGRVLRLVAGAPDYDRYLAHVRACHPGTTPLSRDEFVRQRQDERYSTPGARCC